MARGGRGCRQAEPGGVVERRPPWWGAHRWALMESSESDREFHQTGRARRFRYRLAQPSAEVERGHGQRAFRRTRCG
jgi:hypothetical protein